MWNFTCWFNSFFYIGLWFQAVAIVLQNLYAVVVCEKGCSSHPSCCAYTNKLLCTNPSNYCTLKTKRKWFYLQAEIICISLYFRLHQ